MSIDNVLLKNVVAYKTKGAIKEEVACDQDDGMVGSPDFALDVYREHLGRRHIIISGVIDATTVEKVTLQISRFNELDDVKTDETGGVYDRMSNPIYLKIASPGGYVDYGMGIVSQIVQSRTPIIGYAVADISSMATIIFASCHARLCAMYSRIMIHSLASGFGGKLFDKIDDVEESKKIQQILDEILISRTLITKKQLDRIHESRKDWYMGLDEAIAVGLVDEKPVEGIKLIPIKKRMAMRGL